MRLLSVVTRTTFLVVMVAFSLGPFYWMVATSVSADPNPLASGNPWWPGSASLHHYGEVLASGMFRRWVLNTVVVTGATVAISLICSVMAAFALAYLGVAHSRSIVLVFFVTYLLPQGVIFIPLVRLLAGLHLLNSPLALVLTYPGLVIPFGTWVMWSAFREVPADLIDQGRLEGAGWLQLVIRLLVPMARPALAAEAIFAVAVVLNDFLYSFTFIAAEQNQTLMGALATTNTDMGDPGFTFAAMLLGTAPLAVFCAFFADAYARGLATGLIEA